jgi:hypothetical protein
MAFYWFLWMLFIHGGNNRAAYARNENVLRPNMQEIPFGIQ